MTVEPYDLVIVGAGMVGSACARHASLHAEFKICLVGPEEPQKREGHSILGAYYDEGRISRTANHDEFWAQLAEDSIARYQQLQYQSGITFYQNAGVITSKARPEQLPPSKATEYEKLSSQQLQHLYPYIRMKEDEVALLEKTNSGYINPRQLRQAELSLAKARGCRIVEDIVETVTRIDFVGGSFEFEIKTAAGHVIHTKKVLLASGAFTGFRKLLPGDMRLSDVELVSQVVLFAEVSDEDRQKLSHMPAIVHSGEDAEVGNNSCYILPPIRYPDGKYYVKIGHGSQYEKTLTSEKEVAAWYTEKVPHYMEEGMKRILLSKLPDLKPLSFHTDTCVTCNTGNRRPYLDVPWPGLGVALGGNGYAAKSCDQMAKLAVDLLLDGVWGYPQFPQKGFRMKYTSNSKL